MAFSAMRNATIATNSACGSRAAGGAAGLSLIDVSFADWAGAVRRTTEPQRLVGDECSG